MKVGAAEFFSINPQTGVITLRRPLDSASYNQMEIVLVARDNPGAPDSFRQTGTATLQITVAGNPENFSPTFMHPSCTIPNNCNNVDYYASVQAGSAPVNPLQVQPAAIKARDARSTNRQINYSFINGKWSENFQYFLAFIFCFAFFLF